MSSFHVFLYLMSVKNRILFSAYMVKIEVFGLFLNPSWVWNLLFYNHSQMRAGFNVGLHEDIY